MSILDLFGPLEAANDNDRRECLHCGNDLPPDTGKPGRKKKFCDARCTTTYHNKRNAKPANIAIGNCVGCGAVMFGRVRKFCTPECRTSQPREKAILKQEKNCVLCDAGFFPKIFRQKFCSNQCLRKDEASRRDVAAEKMRALGKAPERTCEHCGVSFKSIQKEKKPPRYCSKTCSGLAGMAAIQANRPLAAPKPASHVVYRPFCDCCGVRFTAPTKISRLCSDECKRLDAAIKARERAAANDNKSPVKCRECAELFTPSYGDKRREFCSDDCSKRSSRRVRKKVNRARLKAAKVENVDPTKVFDRDKWRCQLCGVKTPRKLRGSYEPNAPELDHIIPLSVGGDHSYANTQCACRSCNAAKGATPKGQMRLFG